MPDLFDDFTSAHIWSEHFRDHHAAVLLLEVFEDGCYRAAYCEAGSVQSVNEFRFCILVSLEADVGASCLEILEVRAAGDLNVSAVARHPDLDVICHGRAESEIAC